MCTPALCTIPLSSKPSAAGTVAPYAGVRPTPGPEGVSYRESSGIAVAPTVTRTSFPPRATAAASPQGPDLLALEARDAQVRADLLALRVRLRRETQAALDALPELDAAGRSQEVRALAEAAGIPLDELVATDHGRCRR